MWKEYIPDWLHSRWVLYCAESIFVFSCSLITIPFVPHQIRVPVIITSHYINPKLDKIFLLCNWISLGNDSTKMKITRLKEYINCFNFRSVFKTKIQSVHSLWNCNRSFRTKRQFVPKFCTFEVKKDKRHRFTKVFSELET